jgi:hypothetical protein
MKGCSKGINRSKDASGLICEALNAKKTVNNRNNASITGLLENISRSIIVPDPTTSIDLAAGLFCGFDIHQSSRIYNLINISVNLCLQS